MLHINFCHIQPQSRGTTPAKEAQFAIIFNVFPCFTICIFARNVERDDLERVGSTNRGNTCTIGIRHMEYPKIPNQNFWSNGKHPWPCLNTRV